MMKSLLLTALFLLIFTRLVSAQQQPFENQSRSAKKWYQQALRLQQKGNYTSSLVLFEKASQQFKKQRLWRKHIDCDNEFTHSLILLGRYNEALKKAGQTLQESLTNLKDTTLVVVPYTNLGTIYFEKGEYDKALTYYNKVLQIQRTLFGDDHLKLVDSYINLGNVYTSKAEYDKALAYFQKSVQIRRSFLGNTHPDLAYSYFLIGNIYFYKREFDKALDNHQKALKSRLAHFGKIHPEVANSYNSLGSVYQHKGEYDTALEYHLKALQMRRTIYGEKHLRTADSYNNLGSLYRVRGEYTKALEYLQKGLQIRRATLKESHHSVSESYIRLGSLYQVTGEYEKALEYHQKALQGFLATFGKVHPAVADSYKELGNTYFDKGEYDKALENYQQTLEIRRVVSGEAHTSVGNSYYVIGNVYAAKGEYDKALEYFHKALQIRVAVHGEMHHNVADSYNNLGNIYQAKGDYTLALEYHQKALLIRLKVLNESHPKVADSYNNLGKLYYAKKDYGKALEYHQKAVNTYLKSLGESHPGVAEAYNNLGNIYQAQGDYKLALEYHQKALQGYRKTFGNAHPGVADTYNYLGNVYRLKDEPRKSLQLFQKAIMANVPSFQDSLISHNPILAGHTKPYLTPVTLLLSLQSKAEVLEHLFNQSHAIKDLILALQTSCSADSVAYKIQQNYTGENDKVAFTASAMKLYQQALPLCLKVYQLTKDQRYLDKAFYFAERGKASVLTASLAESKAKTFAEIPDSLLQQDQLFRSQMAQFSQRLVKELAKGKEADSSKLVFYQNNLFRAHLQQEKLVNQLEKKYPKFYSLKYQLQAVTPKQLQGVLDEKTALLDYVLTDTLLQVFIMGRKFYKVESVVLDSLFQRRLTAFRESILYKDHDLHQQVAYALYQLFIPASLPKSIKSLIIIPAGELTTFPFEALLTKPREVKEDKRKAYLLKKYNVSYAYSAGLLYERLIQTQETENKQLLAMAPVFESPARSNQRANIQTKLFHQENYEESELERVNNRNNITSQIINQQLDNVDIERNKKYYSDVRNNIIPETLLLEGKYPRPLPASEREVKNIAQLFQAKGVPAKVFLHQQASENQIKSLETAQYNFIHLATHGFVNEKYPELSGLVLAPDKTDQEDGILYTGEIYNLHLKADLVTLSACETGLGKIVPSEGVIGLTRALLYAGAKNIMVSVWKVSDESTADLMEDFYRQLLSGKSKARALHAAKRKMLKQDRYSQPYYWAPFILIGK
ncbi:CHAT domain-containing protein [Adhaeribacter radiodurans]|uniref:Tetratricopeptide repeat protein n=1 Tax=Adhaeribacter radiodurans TaxID=2745197 RepID=A0A7L7LC22_9BACT|nr:CHAT domain-containing protein [Adhaeribacter radiodurans]QMU29929.1 tetratricopeptide repeat protein [Adhaeribacter radiodurans]